MSYKPPKQDSWSSLLSELGVEDPAQQAGVPETSLSESSLSEPEPTEPEQNSASEPLPSGKTGKFGSGIMPELPSLPGTPKKSGKMTFFDRLASINLFGGGTPEKIDPKVIAPTIPETSNFVEEILEPKKLQKIEEAPKEPKKENRPQIGAVDPWSKIATQLGVHAANALSEQQQEKQEEETQSMPEPVDEIPDIELMTSFRDLPSKKKKINEPAPPAVQQVERREHVSEPAKSRTVTDFPRKDRYPVREDRKAEYVANKRGQQREKPEWNKYENRPAREEHDERIDLDDVNPVASSLPDDLDDNERLVFPKKHSRNRRSHPSKYEETGRKSRQDYAEGFEEIVDEYDVLTPPPEREYGPPRDVFADLLPEAEMVRRSGSESGYQTRGSKVRETSFQEKLPAEIDEETDPFGHSNKKGGRSTKHRSRRVEKWEDRDNDVSLDEEEGSYSRSVSTSRRRGAKDRSVSPKARATVEEPMDEQEQEMTQLHRNIPGWNDAILPIIESNVAKHASRSNPRKGNRQQATGNRQ